MTDFQFSRSRAVYEIMIYIDIYIALAYNNFDIKDLYCVISIYDISVLSY